MFDEIETFTYIGSLLLFVALPLYLLVGGWSRKTSRGQIRLVWFLILPPVVFAALWLGGIRPWAVFWWSNYGDHQGTPPATLVKCSFIVLPLTFSVLLYVRLITGFVTPRFLRISLYGALLLLLLAGITESIEYASHVSNTSARESKR